MTSEWSLKGPKELARSALGVIVAAVPPMAGRKGASPARAPARGHTSACLSCQQRVSPRVSYREHLQSLQHPPKSTPPGRLRAGQPPQNPPLSPRREQGEPGGGGGRRGAVLAALPARPHAGEGINRGRPVPAVRVRWWRRRRRGAWGRAAWRGAALGGHRRHGGRRGAGAGAWFGAEAGAGAGAGGPACGCAGGRRAGRHRGARRARPQR